ncbi:hypothetical protein JTE90_004494, partial [Oedothorax gibbosus]
MSDASHNNTEGTVADTPHDDNFEDGAPLSDNNLEDADQHSDDNLEDGSSSEDDNVDVGSPPDTDDSRRPRRNVKLPAKLHDYHLYQAFTVNLVPESFEDFEKLSSKEQVPWGKAMNQEMESLKKNKVWELVDLPNVENALSCRWVLRIKRDNIYKARLVVRGYEQKFGVDYFETFAPVVGTSSLRLVLAIALQKEMKIFALD